MQPNENHGSSVDEQIIRAAGWTRNELYDPTLYIRALRAGINTGKIKSLLVALGVPRSIIAHNAMTDETNLARFFRRESVPEQQSEALLDTAKVYLKAVAIFEDKDLAAEWMNTEIPALGGQKPLELMDSFEGRRWVTRVLGHLETGDFS